MSARSSIAHLRANQLPYAGFMRWTFSIAIALACACSEPEGEFGDQGFLVVGTVRQAGLPQPGLVVRIYGFLGACREPDVIAPPVTTGSAGTYRYQDRSPFSPGTEFCGLARAYFNHAGIPESVTVSGFVVREARLARDGTPLDSTLVDFDLPPP
jgi:hypothetical protein